jgi:hypothetical protein
MRAFAVLKSFGLLSKPGLPLVCAFLLVFTNNLIFSNIQNMQNGLIDILIFSIFYLSSMYIYIKIARNILGILYFFFLIFYLLIAALLLNTNFDALSILTFVSIYSIASIITILNSKLYTYVLCFIFISLFVSGFAGLEGNFADEEFVLLAQGLLSGWVWLVLHLTCRFVFKMVMGGNSIKIYYTLFSVLVTLFAFIVVEKYQKSFYTSYQDTKFPVTLTNPFICEQSNEGHEVNFLTNSSVVFKKVIDLVSSNPNKQSPEYGMLALATGEQRWADAFRAALLLEASRNLFAGPAGSVKFYQYFAALRVYFYAEIVKRFPSLFNDYDKVIIRDWFARINTRTHSIDWVDWLYAISTGMRPQGPYHNQEVGAGLLALLEKEGLVDSELSLANLAYLRDHLGGWAKSFRVTDDTLLYQREWITTAFFQDLYRPTPGGQNKALSFEWLKLQTLPNGDVVSYNLPREYRFSLAPIFYLGAQLTGDRELIWLAGKSAEWAERQSIPVFAQPGAERPPSLLLEGLAPHSGSCLMFGDSGLATRRVPLVPDKAVLRDRWSDSAAVALVNLRFSGWHRYKATGAILGVFHRNLAIADRLDSVQQWSVLPAGRSLVRDKRIPREALNGVTLLDRGVTKLVRIFSGIGSPWAQDPPHYAEVESFMTGDQFDAIRLRIPWDETHWEREMSLNHRRRELVVVDRVTSPWKRPFLLNWHVVDRKSLKRDGDQLVINDCVYMSIEFKDRDAIKIHKEIYGETLTLSLYSEFDNVITTKFSFTCDD